MFQHVLVAVDGSNHAKRATAMAAEIASRFGALLTILHVMPHLGSSAIPEALRDLGRIEHVVVTEADALGQMARAIVDDAAGIAVDHGMKTPTKLIDDGDAADRIIACCKKHDVDLIVMGRRGLSDLAGLMMGSVSHKIGHLAPCPCLTVPEA